MDLKLPTRTLSIIGSTLALAFVAGTAGAVTLQSERAPVLELRPSAPDAAEAEPGWMFDRINPQNIEVRRPVRPDPPGMLVRMTAPEVAVPRSALPPVYPVPIGPTLPLYILAWITTSVLITCLSLRERRVISASRHWSRPDGRWQALRARLPDLSWVARYSQPGPWPGYRISRCSSASKL